MTAGFPSIDLSKNPTSLFLSLPREIRDEICAYLLRAGDLAILRTSKQLGHEAKERLYREGVCRMKIGFPNGGARGSFFPQKWKNFQNFHFRIFYGPGSKLAFCPVICQLERFANLNEAYLKNECLIAIEYCSCDPRGLTRYKAFRMNGLVAGIKRLTTFKTIVVMLVSKPYETWCGMAHSVYENTKAMVDTRNTLKGRLEPGLGPAKLVGDADGEDWRMVFHPRSSQLSREKAGRL